MIPYIAPHRTLKRDIAALSGRGGGNEIPAGNGGYGAFSGIVSFNEISVVQDDAQRTVLVHMDTDDVIHIDEGRIDFNKSAYGYRLPFFSSLMAAVLNWDCSGLRKQTGSLPCLFATHK